MDVDLLPLCYSGPPIKITWFLKIDGDFTRQNSIMQEASDSFFATSEYQ